MDVNEAVVAFSLYYATGEGVTLFVVIGSSVNHAEKVFRDKVPDYYHPGLTTFRWDDPSPDFVEVKRYIPQPVLELLAKNPRGTTEHFSHMHYNLS
ncbi:MAG: hypothetical protein ABS41_03345 [Arenimonas sp. SCN 70-307]|uniref:hypothetical protein n=1 Tax=Arenimonas sp. SCN 70-307 TaxID=1660089 RepID=UPI0008699FB3|nr:hypothetical protein [Arenimonas sp. SCN 70-307]ODS64307.1 MAG: hypothetical protein ABS41_03345 [Arenimonas sp. SCN 70-307]